MDLFELVFRLASQVSDFKLKSQFMDAAQSVSANVAEGYGRRTLPEYIQFLYTSKGSLAETLTRAAGLWRVRLINDAQFDEFDVLHYEAENKLLGLIHSMEAKRGTQQWPIHSPSIHQSTNPLIHYDYAWKNSSDNNTARRRRFRRVSLVG